MGAKEGTLMRGLTKGWCVLLTIVAIFALAAPFAVAEDDVVVLRVMTRGGMRDVLQAFQDQNPHIRIEIEEVAFGEYVQKFRLHYAAGVAPDVIFPATSWAIVLGAEGALLDLREWVDEDFLADFVPQSLELYSYEGALYGLPNDMAALATYINVDHFEEAGLFSNFTSWTWDEFVTMMKRLTLDRDGDGIMDRFGMEHMWYPQPFLWSATGNGYFDNTFRPTRMMLDEPKALQALQALQNLIWQDHVIPRPGESASFTGGTASSSVLGHWSMSGIMASGINWQLVPLPRFEYQVQRGDGSGWSVASTTKHPEEAVKLVKFLAGEGGQTILAEQHFGTSAYLPVLHGVWRNPPDLPPGINKMAFLAGTDMLFSFYDPVHPVYDYVFPLVHGAVNNVLGGSVSPEQAVEQIKDQVAALLAEHVK